MNKTSVIPYSVLSKLPDSISDITPDYGIDSLLVGKRVWCLYRVSTNQQVDHDEKNEADIPMQRKACHRFAEKMGWAILHEEQEEGVSGHKVRAENRDKLQIILKVECMAFPGLYKCLLGVAVLDGKSGGRLQLLDPEPAVP